MERAVVHFDGASASISGHYVGGWGCVVEGPGFVHEDFGNLRLPGDLATNNVAEYTAAVKALEYLVSRGFHGVVEVYGDSQLVIRQFSGEYRVRASHLKPYHERLLALAQKFSKVTFTWVPREENYRADALSKQGLGSPT